MSHSVVIHGVAFSSYVRSVLICCEEKGVSYQLREARPHSTEIIAMNSFGKIPVLQYRELTLYESAAICRFIDRQFEGPALSPQTLEALAQMDQWISVANCYIAPTVMRGVVIEYAFPKGEDGQVDQASIDAALPDVARYLKILDDALNAAPYFAADVPTIVDYLILPMLDYLSKAPPGKQLMDDVPATSAWLERMRQRPGCSKILAAG